MKNDLLTVLKREHKKSKIFCITSNRNMSFLFSEWCIKNKVKLLIHEDINDNEVLITRFKYEDKSSYWFIWYSVENEKYQITLHYNIEKNIF